jgi:5S rRNA maturation endonuclease (ribonuclease M5)
MKTNQYNDLIAIKKVTDTHIETLLSELGVEYKKTTRILNAPCPVHNGDNNFGLIYYFNEPGYARWRCNTQFCNKEYGNDSIGLISGILKQNKTDTINWILKTLNINRKDLAALPEDDEKLKFIQQSKILQKKHKTTEPIMDRAYIRSKLEIPAQYYINRGYSPQILDKYDVGYNDFYGRVSIPFYNVKHTKVIGVLSRSMYEQCDKCKQYHDQQIDCPEYNIQYAKWINSKGFETSNHLYNLWFAKDELQNTRIAIIVEGAGDVWRLAECGINNTVGLCGLELSKAKEFLLLQYGVMGVILLLDMDGPGRNAIETIKKKMERTFNVIIPKFSAKDIGNMSCTQIKDELEPIITKVSKIYAKKEDE